MDADLRAQLSAAVIAGMRRADQSAMVWGRDDCGLWVGDIVRSVLKIDPCAELRDRYHSREEAYALLGARGLGAAIRRAAKRHGWRRAAPADALAGDIGIVMAPAEGGVLLQSTVVCRAQGWFVGRNEEGFTLLRPAIVRIAWSVL